MEALSEFHLSLTGRGGFVLIDLHVLSLRNVMFLPKIFCIYTYEQITFFIYSLQKMLIKRIYVKLARIQVSDVSYVSILGFIMHLYDMYY